MSASNINTPFFSIIVPTNNRIDFLSKALSSIKNQSYTDYEVIIVDDGSSQSIRKEYDVLWKKLDSRFNLHLVGENNAPRRGPSFTRNYGILNSNSHYIAFLDDDDFWSDDSHLQITASLLKKYDNIDLFIANQNGVRDNKILTKNWLHSYVKKSKKWQHIEHDAFFAKKQDMLKVKEFPSLNISILKRDFQQKVGLLNENLSYCEDLEYAIRLIDLAKNIIFRSTIVATVNIPNRTLTNNASTRLNEMEKQRVYVYISSILCTQCITTAGIKRGKMLAGWAYKTLAHDAANKGKYGVASHFAMLGTVAWPTLPFILYNLYWFMRSLFSSNTK